MYNKLWFYCIHVIALGKKNGNIWWLVVYKLIVIASVIPKLHAFETCTNMQFGQWRNFRKFLVGANNAINVEIYIVPLIQYRRKLGLVGGEGYGQCPPKSPKLRPWVWVRSASVVPKRNNELMTCCYVWVRQMPIVPKFTFTRISLWKQSF